jgi:dolichol-phosphate mannosyltransferase
MKASIILPTYNERDNICSLIESLENCLSLTGWESEIVVIDDNSPDGTADVVRLCQEKSKIPISLFVRTQERGLATAIKYGFERSSGDWIAVMDTDFNHDPDQIPQMLGLLQEFDLVIGSRFVKGGGMEDRQRHYYSQLYNLFIQLILWTPVHDNLSGFFAMRREKLIQLNTDAIFQGYGEYFIRLIHSSRKSRYRICEIPVFYKLRMHGESKSNFTAMIRDYTACVISQRFV